MIVFLVHVPMIRSSWSYSISESDTFIGCQASQIETRALCRSQMWKLNWANQRSWTRLRGPRPCVPGQNSGSWADYNWRHRLQFMSFQSCQIGITWFRDKFYMSWRISLSDLSSIRYLRGLQSIMSEIEILLFVDGHTIMIVLWLLGTMVVIY